MPFPTYPFPVRPHPDDYHPIASAMGFFNSPKQLEDLCKLVKRVKDSLASYFLDLAVFALILMDLGLASGALGILTVKTPFS